MTKKRVLLTGASGHMGSEAFKELLRRKDRYDVVVILRPSKKNKEIFAKWETEPGVRIVWGDLTELKDVQEAMKGVEHVLHPAAFISPEADMNPVQAKKLNHGGMLNLIEAIKREPDGANRIRFTSIGSVAEIGDRLPPIHMVRVGDPLKPSVGDFYATTKMAAERALIESGLKYWVSIRQTFIATAQTKMEPIMYHQPLNTHIELVTGEDAGYGLVQTLETPEDFWCRVYNMGGGPRCRVVFMDYLSNMLKMQGLEGIEGLAHPNWFALRNFHCCWYDDSHVLNSYLGHWRHTLEDHYQDVLGAMSESFKKKIQELPRSAIRDFLKSMAETLKWIENNETEKIKAFYGSREAWEKIPDWDRYQCVRGSDAPRPKEVEPAKYTIAHMKEFAESRGGKCLSTTLHDLNIKLRWKCGLGHEFEASPTLVKTGHWCPQCVPPPWRWDDIAKSDPLFAQFYYNNHSKDERQVVEWLYCPNE